MPPVKSLAVARPPLPLPLYQHVKQQMSERILSGAWAPGEAMPGEVALAAQYGVAVGTIRRALADLVAEGLLVRRRKLGTVVTGRAPQHSLRFFFQFFRLHGTDGTLLHSDTEVLSLAEDAATPAEAEAFGDPGPVLRLHRLRLLEGHPAMHERMVLPAGRLPGFPRAPAQVPPLLYRHLLERYDIRVGAVRESVSAELAGAEDAALLKLATPAALLVIHDTSFDQAGTPVILGHHRFCTRDGRYLNEVR
jgi:GntR family transcriptional regulator